MITNRVLLGIAVTNMVFRHPTVLAGAAASLNEISEGRAILGLGTGDGPVYSQGLKATPIKQFEEGVRMVRELVQGKAIKFPTGNVGISFNLRPTPVYVSAEGPKGLQLAGRCADGVILGTGFDLRVYEWAKQKIRDGAAEAERNAGDIAIVAAGMLCVREDGTEARKIVRNRIANRAQFPLCLRNRPAERAGRREKIRGRLRRHETNGRARRPRSRERLSGAALFHRRHAQRMHRKNRRVKSRRSRAPHAYASAESVWRDRRSVCR